MAERQVSIGRIVLRLPGRDAAAARSLAEALRVALAAAPPRAVRDAGRIALHIRGEAPPSRLAERIAARLRGGVS